MYKEVEFIKTQFQLSKIPEDILDKVKVIMKESSQETLDRLLESAKDIPFLQRKGSNEESSKALEDKITGQTSASRLCQSMMVKSSGLDLKTSSFEAQVFGGGYDSIPNRVDHKIKAHEREATSLAFNFSGSLLATGGADSVIKIWDMSRGCESVSLKGFSKPISCLSFARDSEFLMIACSVDRQIQLCQVKPHKVLN